MKSRIGAILRIALAVTLMLSIASSALTLFASDVLAETAACPGTSEDCVWHSGWYQTFHGNPDCCCKDQTTSEPAECL